MARNGPTSLPLGLSTPSVAATSSTGNAVLPANTIPAPTMSSDPRNSVRRRPNRSARVVSRSEIAASPSSVSAEEQPDLGPVEADRPEVQDEDDGEEAVAEHPQAPGREQQHDVAAGPVSVHPTIVPDTGPCVSDAPGRRRPTAATVASSAGLTRCCICTIFLRRSTTAREDQNGQPTAAPDRDAARSLRPSPAANPAHRRGRDAARHAGRLRLVELLAHDERHQPPLGTDHVRAVRRDDLGGDRPVRVRAPPGGPAGAGAGRAPAVAPRPGLDPELPGPVDGRDLRGSPTPRCRSGCSATR